MIGSVWFVKMKVISKKEFLADEDFFLKEVKLGKIFIYPTDTIYGIGCDATNSDSVLRVREIKKRDERPFSVVAPNKKWILENCVVEVNNVWLAKLPGKYTLILRLKNKKAVAKEVNSGKGTLGVRIPDNWFAKIVMKFGNPFVTTSVNLSGESPIESIEDLNEDLKKNIDYFVDEGILSWTASTIVDLTEGERIISRG